MSPPASRPGMDAGDAPRAAPIVSGSSKVFYATEDPGVLCVRFRDAVHGGARSADVPGTGRLREEFCFYFYRLLESHGIETQLAKQFRRRPLEGNAALTDSGILVQRLDMVALELITRFVARGHWADAHKYPLFAPGVVFDPPVVDVCLKWSAEVENVEVRNLRGWRRAVWRRLQRTPLAAIALPATTHRDDPRIGRDLALALHRHSCHPRIRGRLVESADEWEDLRRLSLRVSSVLAGVVSSCGWQLEDGKFEVGLAPGAGGRRFLVADEYTQDSARVRSKRGHSLTKDLFRNRRPDSEIRDGYAQLTDAMKRLAP